MIRKFLEDLGITDKDTIDKILNENSSDIGKAKGELETVQNEVKTLKGQVKERDEQLETLKNSTGDIEALKTQISTLQADNKAKDEAHAEEIKQIKINNAIETALTNAKAKNNIAVKALLNLKDAELNEDGTVRGLKEQIDGLVKGEDTKFLFDSENTNKFKGAKPGETGKEEPDGKVDLSQMTYDERAAYLNEHPEIEV